MGVQFAVHQQNVVPEVLRRLDLDILIIEVGSVQVDHLLVFVGLFGFDCLAIVFEAEELAVGILEQCEVHGALAELLVGKHAVLNEEFEVVPFLLELLTLLLEDFFQSVGDLLGNIGADLLDVGVALQVAPGHIQRDVRGVDHAVKQSKEIRHYVVDVVRNEHLVAVELDLVLVDGHAFLDLGEVKHAGEVERIVHVQMNPEHRFLIERIEGLVEVLVVFFLEFGRSLGPDRVDVVDNVVFLGFYLLAVLPFGFLAKHNRNRHELAVFVEQLGYASLCGELLAVLVEVEGDHSAAVSLLSVLHVVFRRTVAGPFHRLCAILPGKSVDFDLLAHHESGIESEAKVADDALVLVLLEKLACG